MRYLVEWNANDQPLVREYPDSYDWLYKTKVEAVDRSLASAHNTTTLKRKKINQLLDSIKIHTESIKIMQRNSKALEALKKTL